MTDVEILADLVSYFTRGIRRAVTGLSASEMAWQPDREGNSIGVTVWHCSRVLDVLKVQFLEQQPALAEQWYTQGWAQKTGYDPRGIGADGLGMLTGYTQEEVAAIPTLTVEEQLAYLDQAGGALYQYILSLPEGVLMQINTATERTQTVYQLLIGMLLASIGHLGEIKALKALQGRAIQHSLSLN